MIYDLQRANMWKRISAYLLDAILLGMVVVGFAFLLSGIVDYDSYAEELEAAYDRYEAEYGMSFDMTAAEYEDLDEQQLAIFERVAEAFSRDEEVIRVYSMLISLTVLITVFSLLAGYLLLEFAVPLFFKNGQTLGKKIFGIAVMHTNGVKLSTPMLFARTVLGKYTVETMIPVMIVILIYFNMMGFFGTLLLMILGFVQVMLLILTHTRSPIHDLVAKTVTVDFASQMIFDSEEALLAYKTKLHEEKARRAEYP